MTDLNAYCRFESIYADTVNASLFCSWFRFKETEPPSQPKASFEQKRKQKKVELKLLLQQFCFLAFLRVRWL